MLSNIEQTSTPQRQRHRHIVVIDDSRNDFVITRKLLFRSGFTYTVQWAASYDEGLRRISDDTAVAYLVDYSLGRRSGLELIRNARAGGSAKPLLLVTNSGAPGLEEAAMEAGATDFLNKERGDEGDVLARVISRAILREDFLTRARRDGQPRRTSTTEASANAAAPTEAGRKRNIGGLRSASTSTAIEG